MKQILVLICLLVICFISCSKKNTDRAAGSWALTLPNSQQTIMDVYRVVHEGKDGFAVLSASGENATVLRIWFHSLPTVSGSYQPVYFGQLKNGLQANEIGISAEYPSLSTTFYSTGFAFMGVSTQPAAPVAVTVTDGKIQIAIPPMSLLDTTYLHADSAMVEGNFYER